MKNLKLINYILIAMLLVIVMILLANQNLYINIAGSISLGVIVISLFIVQSKLNVNQTSNYLLISRIILTIVIMLSLILSYLDHLTAISSLIVLGIILIIYSIVENRLDINRKYTKNYLLISRITAILIFTSSYILTHCSSTKVDYLGNIGYFIPVGCLMLYNFVDMGLREIEIKKQEKN